MKGSGFLLLAFVALAGGAAWAATDLPSCQQARRALAAQEGNQMFAALRPREHAARLVFMRERAQQACAVQLRAGAPADSLVVVPERDLGKTDAKGPMLIAPPGLCLLRDGQKICP